MGDSDNKEEVKEQDKQYDPKKKADKPVKNRSFFQNIKAEYRRIVWPDRTTVVKESTAVIVLTMILAALIALLDFVIKTGLDRILQIG